MKINFNAEMTTLAGETMTDENGKPITLKLVATNALLGSYQDEQGLSGDEKMKRFVTAQKVNSDETLTIEETALTKKLVGKGYPPLIVGRVWELLEG